jgi:hypothetical protein
LWLRSDVCRRTSLQNPLMLSRNGDTVESIRALIAVPPKIEEALTLYARQHPEDAFGVERVLRFRQRAAEEFERLVSLDQTAMALDPRDA